MRKSAFTLAEILVTLAVIGVIAALVIAPLLKNIQELISRASLKSAYSILSQATIGVVYDNGGRLSGVYDGTDVGRDKFMDDYGQHLDFIRTCDWGNRAECWPDFYALNNVGPMGPNSGGGYGAIRILWAILKNGMTFRFHDNNTCPTSSDVCGMIDVDVNGFKGPNKYGKDIFLFNVYPNRIKPRGWDMTLIQLNNQHNGCNEANPGNYGLSCAAKFLVFDQAP